MVAQEVEGPAEAGQHAEGENIDLQDAEFVDIVLVPFDDGAPFHRRMEDGHDFVDPPAGDDEAAHMLGEMAGKAGHLRGVVQDGGGGRVLGREPGGFGLALADL